MKQHKVLHVITGLTTGGAEMMLKKLLQHEPHFEHVVIALNGSGDTLISKQLDELGIQVHHLNMKDRKSVV